MNPKPPVWTFETFHTAECRLHLRDPGATCICRDWNKPTEAAAAFGREWRP